MFVFPTENEALGISVIEAMACGLPVLAISVGGLKDILQPDEDGLVFQAQNREELRLALDRLLEDPELRRSLGQMAKHTAEERYTQEIVTRLHIGLFRELPRRNSETKLQG